MRVAPTITLVAVLAAAAAGSAAPPEAERRVLLASGDDVLGLGRIGSFSAMARGIDARGRVLVAADLSDGGGLLAWVDEGGVEPLPIDLPGAVLFPDTAVASPGGRIAVRGASGGNVYDPPRAAFMVEDGGVRPLLAVGDVTAEGLYVQSVNEVVAIGDSELTTVQAQVSASPDPADPAGRSSVILAVDAAGARVVAGIGEAIAAERRFTGVWVVGVTAAGAVVFNGWRGDQSSAIYSDEGAGFRVLVQPGDRLPSGRRLREVSALAVGPGGEVLLRGCVETAAEYSVRDDCAIYRTEDGRLRRVAGPRDRTPDGTLFNVDEGFLNDRGDVALRVARLAPCADNPSGFCEREYGLLFVPAGGGIEEVRREASGGWLNDAGAVAVVTTAAVERWRDGSSHTLLSAADRAPGGARYAAGGLAPEWTEPPCVAEDGRVGAVVSIAHRTAALVCADAEGIHVVLRADDPRLEELGFWPSLQCDFADGDEMYLGVGWGVGREVLRATTAAGLEPVIESGDVPVNGDAAIFGLGESVAPYQVFSVNRHGTVVGVAGSDLVRRRRDGPLEVVPFRLPEGHGVYEIVEAEVADDDSVVATVVQWRDRRGWPDPATRVVHVDDSGTQVIARRGPLGHPSPRVLEGGPSRLMLAGTVAVFADDRQHSYPWPFLYDVAEGELRELLAGPELPGYAYLLDVAADGATLLSTEHFGYGDFYFDGVELTQLSERDPLADRELRPLALAGPGAVLFFERQRGRESLSLGGPATSGRCPRIDQVAVPTPTATPRPASGDHDGCAVTAPHRSSVWPALGMLALALLGATIRRRSDPLTLTLSLREREPICAARCIAGFPLPQGEGQGEGIGE